MKKTFEGGHSDFVTSVAFSVHDPNSLASSSTDKTVVVWNVKAGKPTYTFTEAADEVHTVAWSPTAEGVLATGSHDKMVRCPALLLSESRTSSSLCTHDHIPPLPTDAREDWALYMPPRHPLSPPPEQNGHPWA